ncbi:MAG: hypothetical protein JWP88_903 [Flaviaesturariibacter sp.]|nr:hypothetical protein [Flaviaesturariibacter sp.]
MTTTVHHRSTYVLCLFLLFSSLISSSQSLTTGNGKLEYGISFGPLFFLGDLGGNAGNGKRFIKDLNPSTVNIMKSAYAQVYPAEWLGVRLAINQGKLEGYDKLIVDHGGGERFRKDRNLQFKSNIWEAYVGIEVSPSVFIEKYDERKGKFRPYAIAGVGAFHFNPKGEYVAADGTSTWVELQPLKLEGQGMKEYPNKKEYKLTQLEVPVGVGFKYYLKENFFVGLELLYRKTFTDYIDDVSTNYIDPALFANYLTPAQAAMANQLYNRENFVPGNTQTRPSTVGEQRGNPKQNDAFFSNTLRMGWRLPDWSSGSGRAVRQLRCPSFF